MQVFILKYNADGTEGRGPMVIHSVHLSADAAKQASMAYGGIMGIKAPTDVTWTFHPSRAIKRQYDYFDMIENVAYWSRDGGTGWHVEIHNVKDSILDRSV